MVRIDLVMQPGVQIPWPTLDVPLVLNSGTGRQALRNTGPGVMHVGRGRH